MSRLPRPHIPFAIRVQVAARQCLARQTVFPRSQAALVSGVLASRSTLDEKLKTLLAMLFGERKAELHHNPALVNRQRTTSGDYTPPANDPDFLEYLVDDDHDIRTRVRGAHGQHSDLGLARKMKRIKRNRDPHRRKQKIAQPKNFRWPSRPFSRNANPPRK